MSLTALVRATKTALLSDPSQAQAKFEAHHSLVGATEVTVKVGSGHQITVDEPETLGGGNAAANPVEYALAALGSCQAITYRIWAIQLGLQLEKVEIHIVGDINLRGFFGIDEQVRPGFNAVRIRVSLSGPEPSACYEDLAAVVDAHCPVLDLFRNPVPVERELVSATGLSATANDYVVPPFSFLGLKARVRALLGRTRADRVAGVHAAGDLELDRDKWRVYRAGRDVRLGPTESRLLEHLMGEPGQVFSRAQLRDSVWGPSSEIDERTVDVYVGRLRKALSNGLERDPIRTVRGVGYSFDETFGKAG